MTEQPNVLDEEDKNDISIERENIHRKQHICRQQQSGKTFTRCKGQRVEKIHLMMCKPESLNNFESKLGIAWQNIK